MRVLCIGDIVGHPGRQAIRELLPRLVDRHRLDLVIANGENAAGGVGLTIDIARELLSLSVNMLTSGNHIWKYKEICSFLDQEPRLLRPLNYPEGTPGRGWGICETASGTKVGVINLLGRIFMEPVLSPFSTVLAAIEKLRELTKIILVEIHAEATSEKRALGWFLAGKVSAVYGTHTHVATADEEILSGGTGYITDIGMTGPYDSVIGMRKQDVLEKFLSMRPVSMNAAKKDIRLCGVIFDIDPESGLTLSVERVKELLPT